ncbi:MAG: CPBP family glutamic-type intramembrane protease [Rhizomicrobium sp.]
METMNIEPRFRLKLLPLLVTVLLGLTVTIGAAEITALVLRLFHLPNFKQSMLLFLFIQHGAQLLIALIAIGVLKYWFVPADYGLHWPRGRSYILSAILWGLGLALAVNAGNTWLDGVLHLGQATSEITYTHKTVWGWAVFEGLYVGPTEEIPFRALLVTYLAATMPGKLHLGRFNMNWAGIIVALLFALAHIQSFWLENWVDALVQQGSNSKWGWGLHHRSI